MSSPSGPTAIGMNSQTVRQSTIDALNKIECNLADPFYVLTNNKATPTQLTTDPGTVVYQMKFDGWLNSVEQTTIQDGWVSAGWVTAVATNIPPGPNDSPGNLKWSFVLTGTTTV